jgi:hypothetical protein
MEGSIESDPDLAIGTAKELIESCCKAILAAMQVEVAGWDLPHLVRETTTALRLAPDAVRSDADEAEAIRRILGNLGSIAGGIAELRNAYGTGHGRASGQAGLRSRHARLAVGAASTLVVFLFDTYEQRAGQAT